MAEVARQSLQRKTLEVDMSTKRDLSRRGFLGLAGAVAFAPLMPSGLHRAAGANDTLRIGVIGCGARGVELMRDIAARGKRGARTTIAAVCDICEPRDARARSLADSEVVRRWQDLVERPDIDAVVVATPDHLHAPMSIAAMESGKDVYCEEPMTLRLEEAKAFRDVAARTRRIVQIGAQQTSQPRWHLAREIILSGAIGPTIWCQGSYRPSAATPQRNDSAKALVCPADLDWDAFQGPGGKRGLDADRFLNWRKYWDYSNGIAGEVFYHKLAALLVAVGPAFPERVSAAGGIYVQDGREVPDSFVMTAEYPNGLTIVLASSMANLNGLPAVIRGREASIELHTDSVKIVQDMTASNRMITEYCETAARPDHLDDWLRCIRSRERCVCNEEIGCQAMVAIAMAVESYRTGKTLRFDAKTEQAVPLHVEGSSLAA